MSELTTSEPGPLFDTDIVHALREPGMQIESEAAIDAVLTKPGPARRAKLLTATIICAIIVALAGLVVWVWGYGAQRENPGFWQVSLAGMLFWLSVSQGMAALSCALRLAHASWRYPLNRLLDISSLYGLWVIALLPFLVVARSRIYGLGTADYGNNVWRLAGSALFDCLAIGIVYIAGLLLLYLTSLPDFARLRDRSIPGSRQHRLYGALSSLRIRPPRFIEAWIWRRYRFEPDYRRTRSKWVGDSLQWLTLRRSEGILMVGLLCAFVASQTVVGWDFQLASARNWDSSIFAPLYTLGSLFTGCAMAILVSAVASRLLPRAMALDERTQDNLGRLMLAFGFIWFYFRWCDYLTAWYEKVPEEWHIQGNRITSFPVLAAIMLLCCFVIPVFANMLQPVRRSRAAQCTIAVCVLAGVAIQRYLDTLPTFVPNYPVNALLPSVASTFVFIGLTAMFVLTYLLAARYIPVVSWWGTAKEQTRTAQRPMGNAIVTVMAEDPPAWEA